VHHVGQGPSLSTQRRPDAVLILCYFFQEGWNCCDPQQGNLTMRKSAVTWRNILLLLACLVVFYLVVLTIARSLAQ